MLVFIISLPVTFVRHTELQIYSEYFSKAERLEFLPCTLQYLNLKISV